MVSVGDFQAHLHAPLDILDEVQLDTPLSEDYLLRFGDILFVRSNGNPDLVGRSLLIPLTREPITFSGFTIRARIQDEKALPQYCAYFFKSSRFSRMVRAAGQGANIRNLSQGLLSCLRIPLPPLATQKAIVAEIEAEQALVNGNRELIRRFEGKIQAVLARVWREGEATDSLGAAP